MEIIEVKNITLIFLKIQWVDHTEIAKDRISEQRTDKRANSIRTTEERNGGGKRVEPLEICGTMMKNPIFSTLEFQKEKREKVDLKEYSKRW